MTRIPALSSRRPRLVVVPEATIDEGRLELRALIDEGRELGAALVAIARSAQVTLARGGSPATALDELERIGLRHLARMTAAGVDVREDARCPDGHVGAPHGRAA
jgi:hypothetical protein